jgi:hypothetical protein
MILMKSQFLKMTITMTTDPDFFCAEIGRKIRPIIQIDYDKLSPTQQARWDSGTFGSIRLEPRGGNQYYYMEWTDPTTKKRHKNYLASEWEQAIARQKELCGYQSIPSGASG